MAIYLIDIQTFETLRSVFLVSAFLICIILVLINAIRTKHKWQRLHTLALLGIALSILPSMIFLTQVFIVQGFKVFPVLGALISLSTLIGCWKAAKYIVRTKLKPPPTP